MKGSFNYISRHRLSQNRGKAIKYAHLANQSYKRNPLIDSSQCYRIGENIAKKTFRIIEMFRIIVPETVNEQAIFLMDPLENIVSYNCYQ